MHELMHFFVDVYTHPLGFGIALFIITSGVCGFAVSRSEHVWRISLAISAITVLLIPWSFFVERGHSFAPLAYFFITPTILMSYWSVVLTMYLIQKYAATKQGGLK